MTEKISPKLLVALSEAARRRFSWMPRVVEQQEGNKKAIKPRSVGLLSKDALDWLHDLSLHPFRQTSVRDRQLGYSGYRGKKARDELEALGYVRRHILPTGRRGGQLLLEEITDAGYEYLSQLQVPARKPSGKGGYIHKFWQHKVVERLVRNHETARVKVEDSGSGKSVDVALYLPSQGDERAKAIAFEINIENNVDDEVVQVFRDLETGEFESVVVCVDHWERLEMMREKIREKWGQEILSRVEFKLLAQFLE